MNEKWNQRFIDIARLIATWSKDRSRQVGCVIVNQDHIIVATGYNGFPRRIDDTIEARHERPSKYKWTEHAERNAIYAAARLGTSVAGCTIFTPYFPCSDCARAIIQAGIVEVVSDPIDFQDTRWGEDFLVSAQMFSEVGIGLVQVELPIDAATEMMLASDIKLAANNLDVT